MARAEAAPCASSSIGRQCTAPPRRTVRRTRESWVPDSADFALVLSADIHFRRSPQARVADARTASPEASARLHHSPPAEGNIQR